MLHNFFERHRILYDYTDKCYHDQDRKNNIWRLLATEFNITSMQCYKNIRFYRTFVTLRNGTGY